MDTSSINNMRKAGFLNNLAAEIRLFSPKPVLSETGYDDLPIKPTVCINDAQSNEQLLATCSIANQMPVISEGEQTLMQIKRAHRPSINSLMMLNLMLFRNKISAIDHHVYYGCLVSFA